MVEVRPGSRTGGVNCLTFADFEKNTLYPIIDATVSEDAKVVTVEYPTYDKLKENFPKGKAAKKQCWQGFSNPLTTNNEHEGMAQRHTSLM